ncbi:MAG: WYL domain-containing protein [Alcanivorax sp.]|jgi:predicted DNA-binding transcriptional regulator YafY|uniref:helix-turn-helix transcriptional regulator n=1 Tax=Alcanivorax sp. TaxID=1872427 RepID=UPI0032D968BF
MPQEEGNKSRGKTPLKKRIRNKGSDALTNNTTSTLSRQWLLLQSLKRGAWTGTGALQQALRREGIEINLRTIQRDLKTLAERFPLEADGLSPQGWRWRDDAPDMSAPGMTSGQALTFMMVEQHLSTLMPSSILAELRPWFDNARKQLAQGNEGVHRWTDKVRIVPPNQPLIPPEIDKDALHTIQEALLTNRWLDVQYQSRNKSDTLNLQISPLALVQRGTVLYLIATGKSLSSGKATDEVRRYALHRFKAATLREERVKPPKDFDLNDYLDKGGLGFGNGEMTKLKITLSREAGEHLYESRLSEDQEIKELDDGQLEVVATVADTPQLRWWLRAMGV